MELLLAKLGNKKIEKIDFADNFIFNIKYNKFLVHQVVTFYLYNSHFRNSCQKNRSEVRGGGKKPWKQKGTGRARVGSIRSPIWRGGGKVFASKPVNSRLKINKKMYNFAFNSIISELIKQNRLIIIRGVKNLSFKTKDLSNFLLNFNLFNSLIVTRHFNNNLYHASRNLKKVYFKAFDFVNPIDLINYKNILIDEESMFKLMRINYDR